MGKSPYLKSPARTQAAWPQSQGAAAPAAPPARICSLRTVHNPRYGLLDCPAAPTANAQQQTGGAGARYAHCRSARRSAGRAVPAGEAQEGR